MLNLPPQDSPIRDLVNVDQLATTYQQDIPVLSEALNHHRQTMRGDRAIKSVNFLATSIRDGNLYLYRVPRRGEVEVLWCFGQFTELPDRRADG